MRGRIGKLYVLKELVKVSGSIGKLCPAYLHPWAINLGGEGEVKAKDGEGGANGGVSK
jgi:hypothetical protein